MSLPFTIFLVSAAVIVAVFIWVARSTAEPADVDYMRTRRLRRIVFVSLATTLAIVLGLTLPRLPYPIEAAAPEQIVNVPCRGWRSDSPWSGWCCCWQRRSWGSWGLAGIFSIRCHSIPAG